MNIIKKHIKRLIFRIRGDYTLDQLVEMGLKVGNNFHCLKGTILDPSHCWLIDIGNNVTLAPNVHILCHDASTKMYLGYTKIGRVTIGNNVFIGANTVILPGITIGCNVIVGANSTVTHDIPDGMVYAGCPAKFITTTEKYIDKERNQLNLLPSYDESWTLQKNISIEQRFKQKQDLEITKVGFVQ